MKNKKESENIVLDLGYNLLEEYTSKTGIRVIIKDNAGYKYDLLLSNLKSTGIAKSFVNKANPFTLENIALWLKLNKKDFLLCSDNTYTSFSKELKFYHPKCKEYFYMDWDSIRQEHICSVCSGQQVGKYNNLAYKFPEIAKEWHSTKNGDLTPDKVTYGSGKKVWWLCPNNHEYFSSIASRTNVMCGCKQCADEQKESKIATKLKQYFIKHHGAKKEYEICTNPNTNRFLPFDIYIPDGKNLETNGFYVEIHGHQHYRKDNYYTKTEKRFKDLKYRDKLKKNFAKKYGLYIEIDLRKIKTVKEAVEYILKRIL